jgi:hypothetical protein
MGRLDDIVARNKNPRAHRKFQFPIRLMMAAFVLLILVLMIFTDLDESPSSMPADAPATGSNTERRVDGVLLYRAPAKPAPATRDAAVDAP